MIHLDFVEPIDPDWLAWIEDCRIETDKIIQSYNYGHLIGITNLYSAQKIKFLGHPFYGKCAYCEAKVEITSPTYVEHYRPKGGVNHFDNRPVMILKDGIESRHPGYYWLAYNWKNLLPTCFNCNTWHEDKKTGKMIGKGKRFPVLGTHAIMPDDEINELPQLINPMWEEPNDHIYVDTVGIIHSKQNSQKGETTLKLFGLNTREALVNGRKKEYDNIKRKAEALFSLDNDQSKITELKDLSQVAKGADEFTMAARKAIAHVVGDYDQTISNLKNIL